MLLLNWKIKAAGGGGTYFEQDNRSKSKYPSAHPSWSIISSDRGTRSQQWEKLSLPASLLHHACDSSFLMESHVWLARICMHKSHLLTYKSNCAMGLDATTPRMTLQTALGKKLHPLAYFRLYTHPSKAQDTCQKQELANSSHSSSTVQYKLWSFDS